MSDRMIRQWSLMRGGGEREGGDYTIEIVGVRELGGFTYSLVG